MSKTPIYQIWMAMHGRCYRRLCSGFVNYGARGITVCERWHDFKSFFVDMGHRPEGKSLDRINNDGPYSPENCRWSSNEQQASNKRACRMLTIDGRTMTLAQWSKETGIHKNTLYLRANEGWPVNRMLTKPA